MIRSLISGGLVLSLAVSAACSRQDDGSRAAENKVSGETREITGCITGNADQTQFVLTADRNDLAAATSRAAGEPETFTYVLEGGSNLAQYVGQRVTVRGDVKGEAKDIDFEAKSKTEQPETAVNGREVTPSVESKESIEVTVRRLQIANIAAVGGTCK